MLNLDNCERMLAKLPIKDWITKQPVPFKLNYNQWLLKEQLKRHQARIGGKIRVVSVKARKVGFSAVTDGLCVCHIAAVPNANAWIVSCLDVSSEELFKIPLDLVNGWPYPLPKPLTTKITYPHPAGDSSLSYHTAKSVASGRGPALSFLHLSEASRYPSGASFTSLFPSIPDGEDTGIVVESTANGKVGQGETFWKLWEAAVRGDNEYLPVFLTWLDDINCRKDPSNVQLANLIADEKDILQMVGCGSKCSRCGDCHRALECIAWRRWAIPNVMQGRVEDFRVEYPINAEEAFYATSFPAFTKDEMRAAYLHVKEPLHVGRLEIDTSSYGQTGTGKPAFIPDSNSPLKVWALPAPALHYYIGADAARGMGGDYTAVSVFCGQTGEQVCRYANKKTDPESLAKLLFLLGTWYNYAMVTIELTGNLGLWAQKVLRDTWKYRNFYKWKGRDDRTPGPRVIGSIGWETTTRTRDMMLAAFRGALAHSQCQLHDAGLLTQMSAAEMNDGRWEVPEEIHDDIMVSAMIAWIALKQWHSTFAGSVSKQLLGDEVATATDPLSEAKREVANAKGDVDAAIQAHWRKIIRTIPAGGKRLVMLEGPDSGLRGNDALAGI